MTFMLCSGEEDVKLALLDCWELSIGGGNCYVKRG